MLRQPRPSLLLLPLGPRRLGQRHLGRRHLGPHLRLVPGPVAVSEDSTDQRRMAQEAMDLPRTAREAMDLRRTVREDMDQAQMALADMAQAQMGTTESRLAEAAGLGSGRQNTAGGQTIFAVLQTRRSTAAQGHGAAMSVSAEAAARFARGPTAEYAMCTMPDGAWTFITG